MDEVLSYFSLRHVKCATINTFRRIVPLLKRSRFALPSIHKTIYDPEYAVERGLFFGFYVL